MRTLIPLAFVAACTSDPGTDEPLDTEVEVDDTDYDPMDLPADAVDLREPFVEPDWADPVVLRSEPFWIPPYTEKQVCFFSTWDGEDVGIHKQRSFQNDFGHHFIIASSGLTTREVPDGTVVDCTDNSSVGMQSFKPLIIGGTIDAANQSGTFELPEGMGARIAPGQRLVLQAHYVNTSPNPIIVQDELQLQILEADEVETWASPWVNTESDMVIPAASTHETTVVCTAQDDVTMLFMGGHMHEWGTSISVDHERDGVTERIYEIAEWDALYRDAPPYVDFAEGFEVRTGDVFTTVCRWNNDTANDLRFPNEMCVALAMVYPSTSPIICEQD